MRATRDQRWAAVYGAAYVKALHDGEDGDCHEYAVELADEAIDAEPEEESTLDTLEIRIGPGDRVRVSEPRSGALVFVPRSEAAALARLLARFAETGEL